MTKEQETTTSLAKYEQPVTFETEAGPVTLSINQIKHFVARGSKEITIPEAVMFMQLCKFNALNPWIGDAFLIKFGSDPATMVTSKYAYMKRAERAKDRYDGFKAGLILLPKKWEEHFEATGEAPEPIYREGSLTLNMDLIGGWAEVYIKDRTHPVRAELDFSEYVGKTKEGNINRQWKNKPATMIRKCALVGAMREAFPDVFGGLISEEELPQAEAPEIVATPEGETIDIDPETGEIRTEKKEEKEEKEEKVEIKKRLRRTTTQIDGEEIKTCGIDGVHLKAIKNAEARNPAVVIVIDQFLQKIGVKDITFLRKEEGPELVEIIAKVKPVAPPGEGEEETAPGEDETATSEGEQLDLDQGAGEKGTAKERQISSSEGETGAGAEEMIPCPDRGDMEVEFTFCKESCPKYDNQECIHFKEV